jgi:hypothetical protein
MSEEEISARVAARETYPHWEIKSAPLPARSRLFHIEPFGVGTPKVESLTSYVARVSEAHSVTSCMLLRRESIPLPEEISLISQGMLDSLHARLTAWTRLQKRPPQGWKVNLS